MLGRYASSFLCNGNVAWRCKLCLSRNASLASCFNILALTGDLEVPSWPKAVLFAGNGRQLNSQKCRVSRETKPVGIRRMSSYDSDPESSNRKKFMKTTFYVSNGPFKWLDLKVKVFLMRSFFDQEFEEQEFLQGAKQALCVVTSHIVKNEFSQLDGLVSQEAIEGIKVELARTPNTDDILVKENDIQHASVTDLQFIYKDNGQKWANVLVTYFCWAKSTLSKKINDVEIVQVPIPRILKYTFEREFTPGIASSWMVTEAIHSNQIN